MGTVAAWGVGAWPVGVGPAAVGVSGPAVGRGAVSGSGEDHPEKGVLKEGVLGASVVRRVLRHSPVVHQDRTSLPGPPAACSASAVVSRSASGSAGPSSAVPASAHCFPASKR